jgi:hypothetical protein
MGISYPSNKDKMYKRLMYQKIKQILRGMGLNPR